MPHPFSPSGDPKKRKRQLGHVASYYSSKGDTAKAAQFSRGAIDRKLKKKKKK